MPRKKTKKPPTTVTHEEWLEHELRDPEFAALYALEALTQRVKALEDKLEELEVKHGTQT